MAQKNNKIKKLSTVKNRADIFELVEKEREHVFNIASDFILVADVKTGMILDANLTAQRILGKNLSQIRKMHQSQLHPKLEETRYRRLFKRHIEMGKGVLKDIYVVDKNNHQIPFDVNIKLMKIGHRDCAVGIFRDISYRKKIENELQSSLDEYKVLSDSNPDFIFVVDRDYKILHLNNSATMLLGKKKKLLIGQSIRNIFPKKISQGYITSLNKVFKTQKPLIRESKMVVNGRIFYINTNLSPLKDNKGQVYAVLGDVRDLTYRKKAEETLKESEEKYRSIFEMANDGIFLMDGQLFIDCNNITIKMFGCNKKSDVVNHTPFDFSPVKQPDGQNSAKKGGIFIKNALHGKSQRFYWQHSTKAGKPFDAEVSLNVLNLRGKKFIQAIVRDISKQREAEQRLEESQEKYQSVFESVNDIIILTDKKGFIIDANNKLKKIAGYSASELIGRHFSTLTKIITPRSLKIMVGNFAKRIAGKNIPPYNIKVISKGGREIIIELNITVRKINGKVIGLMAVLKDVTVQEQIAEELSEQKHKFETIFDLSPNFIIYKSNDDKFLEVNKTFVNWLGLPKEKIIGKTTYDLILDKKIAKATREDDLKIIKTGKAKTGTIRNFVSPFSGNNMWGIYSKMPFFDLNGKVIGTLTVTNDITKILESEKEIERQKAAILNILEDVKKEKDKSNAIADDLKKFELAVDNASDQIVITDKNGIILHANNSTERITGFKIKDVLGKKIGSKELWGNKMNEEFYQKMWKKIKVDKKPFTSELTNHHKDGSDYSVLINIAPVLNNKGEIIYFVFIERDITKEKDIDRMKTEFVSIASHQLRTPLTGIKWFLELLLNQKVGALNEKQVDFLNQVSLSNERMISLVGDLLSVSRIETGGKKFEILKRKINIVPIVKGILADNTVLIEEKKLNILGCDAGPKKMIILADPDYIRQVFSNIITNAIKYSNHGGKIEIGCKHNDKDIAFFVKDNGIGIPLDEQKRVFEKFFRAENVMTKETAGTGLGLYIAKSIVEGHGGKIWFESKEGKGTTFYFSLPKK